MVSDNFPFSKATFYSKKYGYLQLFNVSREDVRAACDLFDNLDAEDADNIIHDMESFTMNPTNFFINVDVYR